MSLTPLPRTPGPTRRGLLLDLLCFAIAAPLCAASPSAPTAAERPDIGGPFDLESSRGGRLRDIDLLGHPYAVFFGFTHCPEVCPTALAELDAVLAALGDAADLRVLFVTVDPERDTPEVLAAYLGSFDERIVGLHGTAEETARCARLFRAVYRRVPLADGDYTMDHTALVYLMDREGRFFDRVDYRAAPEVQLAAFRRLVDAE